MGGHFLRFQKRTPIQSCFFYLCFLTMDQDVSAETRGISGMWDKKAIMATYNAP